MRRNTSIVIHTNTLANIEHETSFFRFGNRVSQKDTLFLLKLQFVSNRFVSASKHLVYTNLHRTIKGLRADTTWNLSLFKIIKCLLRQPF